MDGPADGLPEPLSESSLAQRARSGVRWTGIGRLAASAIGFALSVVLARLLTPEDFGLVGLVAIFSGLAKLLKEFGLGALVVQRPDLSHRALGGLFWLNVAIGLFAFLVFSALGPSFASFYGEPRLVALSIGVGATFVLDAVSSVPNGLLRREFRFRAVMAVDLVATVIGGAVGILAAIGGAGPWAVVAQSAATSLVAGLLVVAVTGWWPRPTLAWDEIRSHLSFGANLTGARVLIYGFRHTDDLLIGRVLGAVDLGLYSRAYSLLTRPLGEIHAVAGPVALATMASVKRDPNRVRSVYLRSLVLVALVTVPAAAGMLVTAPLLIEVVYGPKWSSSAPLLQLLAIGGLVQPVLTTLGWIYQSTERVDVQLRFNVVTNVAAVALFVVGLQWGLTGVAAAASAHVALAAYPAVKIAGRLIGLSPRDIAHRLRGVLIATALMSGSVWLVGQTVRPQTGAVLALAVEVVFGLTLYAAAIRRLEPAAVQELRDVLWRSRRRA